MNRTTLALFAVLLAVPAFAQLPPVLLTVDPAAEPKPALRYTLLPAGRERVSGNAALHYAKAALARPVVDRAKVPEDDKKLAAWEDAALDKLPVDDASGSGLST